MSPADIVGTATARAHPNVAIAKYWGKRDVPGNVPATPSVSITMGGLTTTTTVTFVRGAKDDALSINGKPLSGGELSRASRLLDEVRALAKVDARAIVESQNDFPTASGLASSASGFAALARAACDALGVSIDDPALSRMARRASASAARSVFGGFVALGTEDDAAATPIADASHWPIAIVVCAATEKQKSVGSTEGMQHTRATSPYFAAWLKDAPMLAAEVRAAIERRDLRALGEAGEASALRMHASMWAARPPLLYWSATTLALLEAVRGLRDEGVGAWATSDAGPHVKVLCAPRDVDAVSARLSPLCARIIRATVGGPVVRIEGSR